jgi:hypothetical protein
VGRLLFRVFMLLVAVVGVTYWAGEQTEVAVLRSTDELGRRFETKLWVVDYQGVPWLRAARPMRSWYERLLEDPAIVLERGGVEQDYFAQPFEIPEIAAELDGVFREKYGVVDWWYGVVLLRDPIPIRLEPVND